MLQISNYMLDIALELWALLSSYLEEALYKFLNEWMNMCNFG